MPCDALGDGRQLTLMILGRSRMKMRCEAAVNEGGLAFLRREQNGRHSDELRLGWGRCGNHIDTTVCDSPNGHLLDGLAFSAVTRPVLVT